jgi:hypothetical protein
MAIRNLLVALFVASAPMMGCAVEAETAPPVYAEGYQPQVYEGATVYYDDVGHPYYYGNGGAIVWIQAGSPRYVGLVNHWQRYRPLYHRGYGGYAHYGYRGRGRR